MIWLLILKIILIAFSIIFLGGIIFFLVRSTYISDKFGTDAVDFFRSRPPLKKKITKRWRENRQRLETREMANLKLAIIEADSIIDDLFKRIGYKGESLGERLEQIKPAQISYIEEIWKAHKVRNSVVHNPDYELSYEEAKQTFDIYEKVLKDFQAL